MDCNRPCVCGDGTHFHAHITLTAPTLRWKVSITTTDGGDWLDVNPKSSSDNALLHVTITQSALLPGTYHGMIRVSDAADSTNQSAIAVELTVLAPSRLLFLPLVARN